MKPIKSQEFAAYDTATTYSEELLNSGFADYLEVLTARQNALNSQIGLITARFNRLQSVVELYRALDGGWWESVNLHSAFGRFSLSFKTGW